MKSNPVNRGWPIQVLAATTALLLGWSPSVAQSFIVESTSVNNGDVNVATEVDIAITFSKPISEVGLPDLDDNILPIDFDFGLTDDGCAAPPAVVAIAPDGCIGGWSLENDNSTLVLEHVVLSEDQAYTLLVLLAVSEDGDILEAPMAVRFSTGDSLPQGSISGKVTSDDVDVTGSIVVLAPGGDLGIISGDDTSGVDALIGFADGAGDYTIPFVPDGLYLAAGVQVDFALLGDLIDAASKVTVEGLAIGLHDADGDRISDTAVVADGAATTGIDIGLSSSGDRIVETANVVDGAIADAGFPGARLSLAAGAPLDTVGTTPFWTLLFTDITSRQGWISVSMGEVALRPTRIDTLEDLGDIVLLLSTAAFTNYANSDQAVEWFGQNGGDQFLSEYPEAVGFGILMDRALFDLLLQILEGAEIDIPLGPGLDVLREAFMQEQIAEAFDALFSKQQALEAWIVGFVGLGDELALHLVAMADDGTPLLVVGSTPAAVNEEAADAAAATWDPSAYLVSISSSELPVTRRGSALAWEYDYYSPSQDSVLTVIVSGGLAGGVISTNVDETDHVASSEPMIDDWIDSPEAVEKADAIAAPFLSEYPLASSTVELSKGLKNGHPELAIWRVTYSATDPDGTPVEKVVDLDASNGVFVTVEDDRVVPTGFSLGQNYPNPFNPETVIPYEVHETGSVTVAVYDALGRQVRVLVDGTQTAGSYQVPWDARDGVGNSLPSGVYLYRLETGNTVETRSMMFVK